MPARILVVDDSAFMRKMLIEVLADTGCEIVGEAADGEQAVAMYAELGPDVVTLDIIMPKMRGLEALKAIRDQDPHAKVIVISTVEQRGTLMKALKHGATDYIVKPFEKDRVVEAIERAFDRPR